MSYHRSRARRNVRMVQISAVGLLSMAGLLAAMPAPPSPIAAPLAPKPEQTNASPAGAPAPLDLTTLAGVWGLAHKTEVSAPPKVNVQVEQPKETVGKQETPEDGHPHFQFIGMVSTPRRTYAYIADPDGKSKFVATGDYLGEYLILGISSEKMVLADCKDEELRHEVLISERPANPPVESSNIVGTTPAAMSTGNPNIGEMPAGFTTGMDPQEQQRLRMQAQDKLKEINDRRGATTQPPNRPGPTNQPRPMTPNNNKPGTKKDLK